MDEKNKRSSHPPDIISAKNYYEKGWRVYSKELCIFTIRLAICKSQFYMFTFNDPCILSMPLYGMGEIMTDQTGIRTLNLWSGALLNELSGAGIRTGLTVTPL